MTAQNMNIARRIKGRRTELNMTQKDVADAVGVAVSTVQRYETGAIDKVKLPVLSAIAGALQVSPSWLVGREEDMTPDPLPDNVIAMPVMRKIPLYGRIACGAPVLADENFDGEVDLPSTIHADFALRCCGDSMINARIFDGDTVYIRQQEDVDNGQIAAVLIGDEATLKRVYKYPDRLELRPENPTFPVLQYEGEQLSEVRILGLAVAFTSVVK